MVSTRFITLWYSWVPRPVLPMNPVAWESLHHHHGVVLVGQVADLVQWSDVAVHGEHPVGDDHPQAAALGLLQFLLQVGHAVVLVVEHLGLAQLQAVDNGGVDQPIRRSWRPPGSAPRRTARRWLPCRRGTGRCPPRPRNSLSFSSSSLWMSWVPQMKRTEDSP